MFDIFKSKQERLQAKVEKFVSLQNEFSGVNTRIDELAIEFATRDSEFKKALEQEKDEFIKGRIESKYQEFIKSHLKNIGTVKREKESLMKAMEKVYSDDPEFQEILTEEKLHKSYNTILSNYRSNKIDLNTCDTLLKAVQHKYISKEFKNGKWEYIYEGNDNIKKLISDDKVKLFDINFTGRDSSNGWKLSIQGKSIKDVFELYDNLHEFLDKENIAHKVATKKRLSHSNKEQSKKAFTIYVPNDLDKNDLAEKIYKKIKNYKGWYDIKTPTGYEHYAGGIFIRNDRDENKNYIPAKEIQKSEATFPFMQPYLETIGEALKNKKETGKVKYADNIVFNKEGKLLLLKRSENDKTFAGMYVIPGGHVDLGEDCEAAAKRELYEEAGIEVEEVRFVGEYEDKKVHIKYYESHTDKDPVLQQEEIWGYEWVELKDLDNYPMPLNMCENIKKVLNPYDFKRQVVKIKKALEDDLINPSQYKALMRNVLEKAKKAHSGEIRTWGNDRMQKQPDGSWKKLFDSKGEKKEEVNEFQKIKDYAERIIKGEQKLERLSPTEEQGRLLGGKRNVEATIIAGAKNSSSEDIGRSYSREEQEVRLKEYAKKEGIWIDYDKEFSNLPFLGKGGEAKVWELDKENVIKVHHFPFEQEPIKFCDRISIHNTLFPEVLYEVVGFTEKTVDGEKLFSFVIKQPFVEHSGNIVTQEEMDIEMKKRGFSLDEDSGMYMNEDYIIGDLHPGNVLRSPEGNYLFIDPLIEINTPEAGYGGKRKLGGTDIAKSTESTLQKALEDNLITPKQYDLLLEKAWTKHPVGTVVTRKDGTRWKKISETGNSKADWKQITKDKGSKPEDAKEAKISAKEEGQTQNPTNLAEAAKNASETALNEAIKTSGDENVRQAAHEELNRREKEEKVQEEPEKKEGEKETSKEENEHVEKFRQLSDDQIKFYLEAPYPKVKEAAKMVADERGLSVVSKEDYIKQFEDFDENPETNEDYFYKNDSRKSFDYLEKNEDISSSLSSYKFDGFLTIREYLSDTDSFSKENEYLVDKLKKDTDNISKFIKDNPLSKNLTLHRRCLSDLTFFTKLKENDIYEDKSFSSTSLQQRAEFGDFHIKILAKYGSRVSNINNKREFEYLIDKGSKFRVIEKHENGLGITVELL